MKGPENRAINVIRALAALLVVLGHVRVMFFEDYPGGGPVVALLYAFTGVAPGAVIVFFVLSGYWVGGGALAKVRAGTFTWSSYASSRLTRLWLVLLPALVVTLVADLIGGLLNSADGPYTNGASYSTVLGETAGHSIGQFLGNAVFLQDILVPPYGTNVALWSLANEFWYYLIFPAAVLVFMGRFGVRMRVVAAVLAVGGALVAGPTILMLFPSWLLGALVASQRDRIVALLTRAPRAAVAAVRLLGVVAVVGVLIGTKLVALPGIVSSLALAVPTAVLIGSLVIDVGWSGVMGRILDFWSWLAGSSYSLYAVHMPLVVLTSALLVPSAAQRWPMDLPHALVGVAVVVGAVVVAIGFAAVTEKRTENVRAALRRWSAHSRPRAAERQHA